jgi:hypothetical protein
MPMTRQASSCRLRARTAPRPRNWRRWPPPSGRGPPARSPRPPDCLGCGSLPDAGQRPQGFRGPARHEVGVADAPGPGLLLRLASTGPAPRARAKGMDGCADAGRGQNTSPRHAPCPERLCRRRAVENSHPEHFDRLAKILDPVQPDRRQGEVELALDLVADRAGGPDAARSAQARDPRRDVDPVAVGRTPVDDHLAQIDADAQPESLRLGELGFAFPQRALDLDRGLDGGHGTAEFDHTAVAPEVDDPAVSTGRGRLDHLLAEPLQPGVVPILVALHEPAVAGQDRQPPLHARRRDAFRARARVRGRARHRPGGRLGRGGTTSTGPRGPISMGVPSPSALEG